MADLHIRQYDISKSPHRQSNYSRRISPETWDAMMPFIVEMFRAKLTRKEILKQLNTKHHFSPSMGQLVQQMTLWHMKRYTPRDSVRTVAETQAYQISDDRPIYLQFMFLAGAGLRSAYLPAHGKFGPYLLWRIRQYELAGYWAYAFLNPKYIKDRLPDTEHNYVTHRTYFPDSPDFADCISGITFLARLWNQSVSANSKAKEMQLNLQDEITMGQFTQQRLHSGDDGLKYNIDVACAMMVLALFADRRDDHENAGSHLRAARMILDGVSYYIQECQVTTTTSNNCLPVYKLSIQTSLEATFSLAWGELLGKLLHAIVVMIAMDDSLDHFLPRMARYRAQITMGLIGC